MLTAEEYVGKAPSSWVLNPFVETVVCLFCCSCFSFPVFSFLGLVVRCAVHHGDDDDEEEDEYEDSIGSWDGRYDSEPDDDTMLSAEEYAAELRRLGY